MKRHVAFALFSLLALARLDANPRLFLVGDSTMSEMPLDRPRRGWGMAFGPLFTDPAMVQNRAANGHSSMSYLEEGYWAKVLAELRPGDFVLVQFGANDELKENPRRFTDPATTFRECLGRYVREARAQGALPLLATPVCRRKFDAAGKRVDTHGAYPDATRMVAREEKVPLIDLERATAQWLDALGDDASRPFFMGRRNPRLPPGEQDIEHFVDAGAAKVSELAADEIRALQLPLVRWLK